MNIYLGKNMYKCDKCGLVHQSAHHNHMNDEFGVFNKTSLTNDVKLNSLTQIEEQLLGALKQGPLTRDQLVKKLELPRTTIYDGLKKLILRNEVKKNPIYITERNRGRPVVLFSVLTSI